MLLGGVCELICWHGSQKIVAGDPKALGDLTWVLRVAG